MKFTASPSQWQTVTVSGTGLGCTNVQYTNTDWIRVVTSDNMLYYIIPQANIGSARNGEVRFSCGNTSNAVYVSQERDTNHNFSNTNQPNTVEVLDVQKTSATITIIYKNYYLVRVKVNGNDHNDISYKYDWSNNTPRNAIVIAGLPTAHSLDVEIAPQYWGKGRQKTGTYVKGTVVGPFVGLSKQDPNITSVAIEGARQNNVTVTYNGGSSAKHYYVQLLQNGSIIYYSSAKYTNTHTFSNVQSGNYSVRVQTIFKDGSYSNWVNWNGGNLRIP
jgi:hypothetical protein